MECLSLLGLEDQEDHALLWDDSPLFFSLQFRLSWKKI